MWQEAFSKLELAHVAWRQFAHQTLLQCLDQERVEPELCHANLSLLTVHHPEIVADGNQVATCHAVAVDYGHRGQRQPYDSIEQLAQSVQRRVVVLRLIHPCHHVEPE